MGFLFWQDLREVLSSLSMLIMCQYECETLSITRMWVKLQLDPLGLMGSYLGLIDWASKVM